MSDYFEWSHYNTSSYPISNPDPIGRMMIVNDDSNDWIDQMLQEIEEEEKEKEKNVEISELFNKIEISDCDVHSVSLKKPSVIQLNGCLSNDPHDEEVNFLILIKVKTLRVKIGKLYLMSVYHINKIQKILNIYMRIIKKFKNVHYR